MGRVSQTHGFGVVPPPPAPTQLFSRKLWRFKTLMPNHSSYFYLRQENISYFQNSLDKKRPHSFLLNQPALERFFLVSTLILSVESDSSAHSWSGAGWWTHWASGERRPAGGSGGRGRRVPCPKPGPSGGGRPRSF